MNLISPINKTVPIIRLNVKEMVQDLIFNDFIVRRC